MNVFQVYQQANKNNYINFFFKLEIFISKSLDKIKIYVIPKKLIKYPYPYLKTE